MTKAGDVAIIGAGAAGLAAARRLMEAGITPVVLEARDRIGGRAWTVQRNGLPLDLGCEWLHSGDRNPWVAIAEDLGLQVDAKPAPWRDHGGEPNFPAEEQHAFGAASDAFYARIEAAAERGEEGAAADWLEPGNRWNPLIDAVSSYYNGTEWHRVSVQDFDRYIDTGHNWHIAGGYGAAIAAYGANVPVRLGCPVSRIDHAGRLLHLDTPQGALEVARVIVTVPPTVLLAGGLRFSPDLPDHLAAAAGLPLGVANKVFLAVTDPGALPVRSHVFGHIDRTATASYLLQAYGRPVVQGYFGGACAAALERDGSAAFTAYALDELEAVFGHAVRRALTPICTTAWADDPWSLGAYSHALPGHADDRARLAATVEDRIVFAGEACSRDFFSTAHGAYLTGRAAAETVLRSMER